MRQQDPFVAAGWYGWAIIAVLAIVLVFSCTVSQKSSAAQERADPARADGPAQAEDVQCLNGYCIVRQDTLREILKALNVLDAKRRELEGLCGWQP